MNKKLVKGLGLAGVVLAGTIVACSMSFANECVILDGKATWQGGVSSKNNVYSKIIDTQYDGYKIYGRVSITDNWWGSQYKENYCKGVGKDKALSVSMSAGLPSPKRATATYSKQRSEKGSY